MKRTITLLLALIVSLSLAACSAMPATEAPTEAPIEAPTEVPTEAPADIPAEGGKTLVVYFSWSPSGNTEKMASTLKEHTGADMLRLEPATAYPADYSECADVAKAERDANARPEIANLPDNLDAYDTIFVGYPIW